MSDYQLGVKVLNKSIDEKQSLYTKKLNILMDTIRNANIEVDSMFGVPITFPKATDDSDLEVIKKNLEIQDKTANLYINHLEKAILMSLDKVKDNDLMNLISLYEKCSDEHSLFDNVVNKSCKECQVKELPKFYRNALGMLVKKED